MGSGESTTRKVSFGVDDEDRVRILRGVKLSEDVLQRMRGVANIPPEHTSTTSPQKETGASHSASPNSGTQQSSQHQTESGYQFNAGKSSSYSKEEQRRYEHQQAKLKEELARVPQSEREAVREEMAKAMTRERQHTRQEAEKAKQMKLERYEQSKEQFHQAASDMEANVSQYRPSVFQPAGSDFILLQGEQRPDPKVFRPCQRIHAVHQCCKEEPAGKPWMKSGRKRVTVT
ncbi:MICOS complex subunit mic25a isoform X5 [Channa argus]|uniref:MICOS complex subunit mic25a isoform X5 n=1 Tax=Channa argus TaxID=215402 RepID=UPI0035209A66